MKKTTLLFGIFAMMVLSSCTENGSLFHSNGEDYITTDINGVYKIGEPYQVGNIWYHPEENYKYKEVGIASWYGPDFHKGVTANGETYDMHQMSAAHKTLPLPSIVKVTNLDNGKFVVVRVNDRGPFVNNRIIDLSKKAAEMLEFIDQGTAKVRVELLPEESKALKKKILKNGGKIVGGAPLPDEQEIKDETTDKPIALIPPSTIETQSEIAKSTPIFEPKEKQELIPVNATKGYFVQLGAFKDYDNALAVQSRFEGIGKTLIVPLQKDGTTLYRVRMGAYAKPDDAVKAMDAIKESGYTTMRLIEEK